jgi:hypothetical protein
MRRPYSVSVEARELLPFRVRLVENSQDLRKAVEIRSSAFSRHVPTLGSSLRDPEADDLRRDVLLLIAERKIDRQVLGSMRLHPNRYRQLRIEEETRLPEVYQGRRLIEFMRLGVENGNPGRTVFAALVKASYEICCATGTDYALAVGRRSTTQIYRSMLFDALFDGAAVVVSYAESRPHWVSAMPIHDAERRWSSANHSLYNFMARTEHPDIQIDYDRVLEVCGTT